MNDIRRHPDSVINYEHLRRRALQERYAYVKGALPSVSSKTKQRFSLFATAFLVATGAFWAIMLTAPPTTVAANPGFSVSELEAKAPLDLPSSTADAH